MSVSDAGRRLRQVATAALCLVAALVLATACTGAAPGPGPVSPAATAAPSDGWLTFDDPAAPFTLRYPGDAVLTHGESSAGVYTVRLQFRVPGADGYQGMLVRVEPNPDGKGLEALA